MSHTPEPEKNIWIVKAIVPLLVAAIGSVGLWDYLKDNRKSPSPTPSLCQINASALSGEKSVIETGQSMGVSIRADNPEGRALIFSWRAVNGTMEPGLQSN